MSGAHTIEDALAHCRWHQGFLERSIRGLARSSASGVKNLVAAMQHNASSLYADREAMATILFSYTQCAEEADLANATAVLQNTNLPPRQVPWRQPGVIRIQIPLRSQFDHAFAMNSASTIHDAVTDTPPVEPFNAFIAMAEKSAAFGAPVICHSSLWPIGESHVCWIAFDAQSLTGRMLIKEAQKLSRWHDERLVWAQIPIRKRLFGKSASKYPMPPDYAPPGEYECRYVWASDCRHGYVEVTQGRHLAQALPLLRLAWETLPMMRNLLRQATHHAPEGACQYNSQGGRP